MNAQKYTLFMEEEHTFTYNRTLTDPQEVYTFLTDALKLDKRPEEHFVILTLDNHNNIIGVFDNTCGGVSACEFSSSAVFKAALMSNATAIIVAHNHPSGDPNPSQADNNTTEVLHTCGLYLGVPVVDHLIIGHNGQYFDYGMQTSILDRHTL